MGKEYSDLHCHLNGSFSLEFLKTTADKNKCLDVYNQLAHVRAEYLKGTNKQPEAGYSAEIIALIWKQFGLIHKIIQNLTDISEGVVDVVQNSKAQYLEIRTTPKAMGSESRDNYIDAFEKGLLRATQLTNKKAFGLLSLDRTIHGFKDAEDFIQRIKTSSSKLLIGLDISGNPYAPRSLSGEALAQTIHLALNNGIPIAIHMAEADTDLEKEDTNTILSALEQWQALQLNEDKKLLFKNIRLGHCINLDKEQKKRIIALGLSIEVCPTCHSKLNWHIEHLAHPITDVYPDVSDPVVLGTDDEFIFGASISTEFNRLLTFFSNKKRLTKQEINEHQCTFQFSNAQQMASASLIRINSILKTLKKSIDDIDKEQYASSHKKATELMLHLDTAKNKYELAISSSDSAIKQASILFYGQCHTAINHAKPDLERDLSWGDFLNNLLKQLYNILAKLVTSESNSLFAIKRPPLALATEEAEKNLNLTIGIL